MKILLITPPLMQWNSPYPATIYLQGFLKKMGYDVEQVDLNIEFIRRIFSKPGLEKIFEIIRSKAADLSFMTHRVVQLQHEYINAIDLALEFLQHPEPGIAQAIVSNHILPMSQNHAAMFLKPNSITEDVEEAFMLIQDKIHESFGDCGIYDQAKFLITWYFVDLSMMIHDTISPLFHGVRYGENLCVAAHSFDKLEQALQQPNTILEDWLCELFEQKIQTIKPTVIGMTVPFPGNLFAALKLGQYIKKNHPHIAVVLGGGYVNTELREIRTSKILDYTDFIALDDGEAPLLRILEHLQGLYSKTELIRTYTAQDQGIQLIAGDSKENIAWKDRGDPDYTGIQVNQYLSTLDNLSPSYRLWTDGFWNKITLAHGCYWHRCSFCDTCLDYIERYEPSDPQTVVDQMEKIIAQTGKRSFHFTDEAAPPQLLRDMCLEILHRKLHVSWWTNVRCESAFNWDLCQLMANAGCIAVAGGIETPCDRLLSKMDKGYQLENIIPVLRNFSGADILFHAYLIYGFPTQTIAEMYEGLEIVRQLFKNALIRSAHWHAFALSIHSPMAKNPDLYSLSNLKVPDHDFACNEIFEYEPFPLPELEEFATTASEKTYEWESEGMEPGDEIFFPEEPCSDDVDPDFVVKLCQVAPYNLLPKLNARVLWLGNARDVMEVTMPPKRKSRKSKNKGKKAQASKPETIAILSTREGGITFDMPKKEIDWIIDILQKAELDQPQPLTFQMIQESFAQHFPKLIFANWIKKNFWEELRCQGLLFI